MTLGSRGKVKSSVILHFSRPVKAVIRRFSFAILILLSLFTLFVSNTDNKFSRLVRSKVTDTMAPIMYTLSVPMKVIANWNDTVSTYFFVHTKNEELEQENALLKKHLIEFEKMQIENDRLKNLLNFVQKMQPAKISTHVVGDVSGPFIRYVLVDAGGEHGAKKGQAVIGELGLVGRVIEVGDKSSRVMLITDINSRIPVMGNSSRERSILAGNNTNDPELLYLSEDSKIQDGEVVVTSGDGELFPSGIAIGTIYLASNGNYRVKPFTKWHRLEHLSLLSNQSSAKTVISNSTKPLPISNM